MRPTGKTYTVCLLLILFAAGCRSTSQPAGDATKPPNGYDPQKTTVPVAPEPDVTIKSISEGEWNIDTNPLLAWTASPKLGEIQFVSVQIFEIVNGKPAAAPCIMLDDTGGELARNNGGRLFDKLDGVLISFLGSHTGEERLKPATSYLLVLKITGNKREGTASVKFSTRQ
jgi:hypothetical protein